MIEPGNTGAASTATDRLSIDATTADASNRATDAATRGVRLIRRLVTMNLGLVGLQALSAGLLLSGYEGAATMHSIGARALLLGVLIQAVTAIVLWRRRRIPAWVVGVSIGLLLTVFLEVGLGYKRLYWLHVPIGIGIFGWLMRLTIKLDTLSSTSGTRS